MVAYAEMRKDLKTGDLVLFSGKGGVSEWIKWFTGSKWSHIGVVLRLEDYDSVLLWESTTLSNIDDVETGKAHRGVQLVGLRERLTKYVGDTIAVRRLNKGLTEPMLKKLGSFRSEVSGRPYEENKLELLRAASDIFRDNKEDISSLFCSELVAEAYQKIGLLSDARTAKPSNEFTPEDFSAECDQELKMLKGYELGPELILTVGRSRAATRR